jgi:hypothetical protein
MDGANILQSLLVVNLVAQFMLAAVYLGGRRLVWYEYLIYGLVALGLPVLGPFLVIASRPGERRRPQASLRRIYAAGRKPHIITPRLGS